MGDWREVLRAEFCGPEEGFLIGIRIRLTWDKVAFDRLIAAMKQCCLEYDRTDSMETWLAEGFFMTSTEVKGWTSDPRFPREHPEEYYGRAYRRLYDLAFWFFTGSPMYLDGKGYDPL